MTKITWVFFFSGLSFRVKTPPPFFFEFWWFFQLFSFFIFFLYIFFCLLFVQSVEINLWEYFKQGQKKKREFSVDFVIWLFGTFSNSLCSFLFSPPLTVFFLANKTVHKFTIFTGNLTQPQLTINVEKGTSP